MFSKHSSTNDQPAEGRLPSVPSAARQGRTSRASKRVELSPKRTLPVLTKVALAFKRFFADLSPEKPRECPRVTAGVYSDTRNVHLQAFREAL